LSPVHSARFAGSLARPARFIRSEVAVFRLTRHRYRSVGRPGRSLVRLAAHPLEDRSTPAMFVAGSAQTFGSNLNNNGCVATGDFNGDGKTDIVLTNYGTTAPGANPSNPGRTLTVLRGQGDGTFNSPVNLTVGSDHHVSFVVVADVDGKNGLDLVCTSSNQSESGFLTVFLNDGSGNFTKASQVSTGGSNAAWVGVGQLTAGDSNPDVIVCHFGRSDQNGNNVTGNNFGVFQGDGAGTFTLINTVGAGLAFIPTAGAIADFTGDGNLDVAFAVPGVPPDANADQPNGSVYLFTGNGAGGFNQGSTFDSGGPLPINLQVGFINGDALPDLVVANAGNPDSNSFYANFGQGTSVGVLINSGQGNFSGPNVLTAGLKSGGSASAFAVAVADFSQDGNADIAAIVYGHPLNGTAARVAVFKGDGGGGFAADPNSPYTTAGTGGQYLAVGTFDGNNTPDLVTCGDSNKIVTLLNQSVASTPTTTVLTSSLNPSAYGQSVTFTATVAATTGTPTGTVSFFSGANQIGGPVTLDGDLKATFSTDKLNALTHFVTAKYNGAAGFAASTSNVVDQVVTKATTTAVLTADRLTAAFGVPITFTVTVSSATATPTGPVTFLDGATVLAGPFNLDASGKATYTTTDLSVGSHTITAKYAGSGNFTLSVSNAVTVTVTAPAADTSVALFTSGTPSGFGSPVTFTAKVSATTGTPTGTVTFFDGAVQIGGPVALNAASPPSASITVSDLAVGPHTISAKYSGAAGFNPSTSPNLSQQINPTKTTTVVTSDGPSVVTLAATLTATVTPDVGTAVGTVVFFDGGVAISGAVPVTDGKAQFSTAALAVGPHTITAQFTPGTGNLAGSTSAGFTHTVNKAGTALTVTSPGASVVTQGVTLTATLTEQPVIGPDATGTVTFRSGATVLGTGPLAGGVATLTISTLPVGATPITAEFAGDANFAASTSPAYTQTVNKAGVSIAVTGPGAATVTTPVTLTATLTEQPGIGPDPSGSVTFKLNGATIGTGVLAGGVATFTTSTLAVGSNPITAEFAGDANFAAAVSNPFNQVIDLAATATTVTSGSPTAAVTQPVNLFASVTSGIGTPAGSVQFFDGPTAISGLVPLAGGKATFTTAALGLGARSITAQYVPPTGGNFAASTSPAITQQVVKAVSDLTVTPTALPAAAGKPATFTATVVKPAGVTTDPTGVVTFVLNGTPVGSVPLVNGTATFTTTSLAAGTNTVTAQFAGDVNFAAATGQTSATVAGTPPPTVIGFREFGVGPGAGLSSTARFFNPDGSERFSLNLFPGFTGGVRVTSADLNGDGVADLIAGTGPGSASQVRVIDGQTRAELFRIDPFEATFLGGVYVAAGDVTGDGVPDILISPDEGGGPRVRVISGKDFSQLADFFGIEDPNFRGGARVGVADMNADGMGDVVVSAGFGGGPRVAAFDAASRGNGTFARKLFGDFFAFEESLRNGVFMAVGDVDGDGIADMIAGGGPGGGPRVTITSGADRLAGVREPRVIADFFAFDQTNRGGVRLVARNLDGDAKADLVVGAGTGAGSGVTGYTGTSLASGKPASLFRFDAFPGFDGGVYVG
jgi:hypothetical protein